MRAAGLVQGRPADAGPERDPGPTLQQHRDRVGHQGARRHAPLRPSCQGGVRRGPEGRQPGNEGQGWQGFGSRVEGGGGEVMACGWKKKKRMRWAKRKQKGNGKMFLEGAEVLSLCLFSCVTKF